MTRKTLSIRSGDAAVTKSWGASGERLERLKERAREERRTPTEAEVLLWTHLSGGKVGGLKFSRKALVGTVLADFACPSRWVVVNISGEGANPELDALQDRKLTETGIRVLRFAEADVLADVSHAVAAIKAEVNKPFDKRTARQQASGQFERSEG